MINETVLNPIEEISYNLQRNGYGEGLIVGHITHNKEVNEDYQYQIIRESTHDGTVIFTMELINDSLSRLIKKESYLKGSITDDELLKLKDVHYTIGDMKLETEYGVKAKFGSGVRQKVSIPVKVEYIF
jgi:hypothetical protein